MYILCSHDDSIVGGEWRTTYNIIVMYLLNSQYIGHVQARTFYQIPKTKYDILPKYHQALTERVISIEQSCMDESSTGLSTATYFFDILKMSFFLDIFRKMSKKLYRFDKKF